MAPKANAEDGGEMSQVYQKYIIQKTNGEPVSPDARYFVLRIDKDDAWGMFSRRALNRMAQDMTRQGFDESLVKAIQDYVLDNSPLMRKAAGK